MSENVTLWSLCGLAATLGLVHTVLGPDHYLPFIAMSRSGRWSLRKTSLVTLLCGLGHVLSSVALGFIGIAFGIALGKLEAFESTRGEIAAWILLGFGLVYCIWGMRRAVRGRPHSHTHAHSNGSFHAHDHRHEQAHVHVHEREGRPNMTPWILFTIFVFGPCEPLIPVLMVPAARHSAGGTALVAGVFSLVTIATMMTIVLLTSLGLARLPDRSLERYTHALAGGTLALCGAGIVFLGL